MLLRFSMLGLTGLLTGIMASPVAAEDWTLYRLSGTAPERQLFLIDRDTLVNSSTAQRAARIAVLSEGGHIWPPQVIAEIAINCRERAGKITRAELRDERGDLLRTLDDAYGGDLEGKEFGPQFLGIVCEKRWPQLTTSYPGSTLTEISLKWFG